MFGNLLAYAILLLGSFTTIAAYRSANDLKYDPAPESTHSATLKVAADRAFNVEHQPAAVCQERIRDLMEQEIGIFEQPPENFNHTVQVSACLIQVENRILALQRGFHKYDPGKWEVPGGKFLEGEALNGCASRELFEETGIKQDVFQELGTLYVRRKEGDFTLRVTLTELHECPDIHISKEHHSYRWVTPAEMRDLDLIKGEDLLIDMYLKAVFSENN